MREFFIEWGGAVMVTIIIVIAIIGGSVVGIHYIDANKVSCSIQPTTNVAPAHNNYSLD